MHGALGIAFIVCGYLVAFLSLGLTIGFSPMIYGVFLSTLAEEPQRRRTYQVALLAGMFCAVAALLLVGAAIGEVSLLAIPPRYGALLLGLLGGACIAYALYRWLGPHIPREKPRAIRPTFAGLVGMFAFGFWRTFLSASSIAAAVVATASITATPSISARAILAVILCIGVVLPFIIVTKSTTATRASRSAFDRFAVFRERHRSVITVAVGCCGAFLVALAALLYQR